MESSGSHEAGRHGEICQRDTDRGRQCTSGSESGKTEDYVFIGIGIMLLMNDRSILWSVIGIADNR